MRFTQLCQNKKTKRDWGRINISESWFLFLLESSFPWRVTRIPAVSSIRAQGPKFPMIQFDKMYFSNTEISSVCSWMPLLP